MYKILNKIHSSADIQALSTAELEALCPELRRAIMENVSQTGGHLGSNLGAVELTAAIHRVYDTRRDWHEYHPDGKIGEGMHGVASSNVYGTTADAFWNTSYSVAAKTGTSQLGEDRTNNGIFICYAPYEDPEIAVAIVLEHGNAGSEAAPIARQIMDYYFSFSRSTASLESDSQLLR